MEKKDFSKFFLASLKRTAQNVYPLVRRKQKLLDEIADRNAELESIESLIADYQIPIRQATGGYTTEDLITRVVTDTGKVDKEGRPIKMTQYVLTYPDTVIPPAQDLSAKVETVEVVEEEKAQVVHDFGASMNI